MDPKEARKYTTANPPIDREAERRPSLLGRLFRRSSSTDEGGISGVNMPSNLGNMGQSVDESGVRRESITEAVQSQFLNKQPATEPSTEFSIFT